MKTARIEAFWDAFRHFQGVNVDTPAVTAFSTEQAVAERLLAKVAAGAMRATVGPMHYFGEGRDQPLPVVGEYTVLLDPRHRPRLIWRTTGVSIAPLSSVSETYLWLDGEGGGNRETWLEIMRGSFSAQARRRRFEMHDDIETMFETFEVVWPHRIAERVRLLDAHFQHGLDLLRQSQRLRARQEDMDAVLARIETAVLILGPGMSLVYANPAGDALLRREDGLRLRERAVTARHHQDARALELAITACVARSTPASSAAGGFPGVLVDVRRTADRPPYRVTVFPVARVSAAPLPVPGAEIVLFVSDRETIGRHDPDEEQLYRLAFRLTPAEAKLASRLASGASLDDAAETLGVTRNTARAQLRALFDKAEARRQPDLVRILQAARTLRLALR